MTKETYTCSSIFAWVSFMSWPVQSSPSKMNFKDDFLQGNEAYNTQESISNDLHILTGVWLKKTIKSIALSNPNDIIKTIVYCLVQRPSYIHALTASRRV